MLSCSKQSFAQFRIKSIIDYVNAERNNPEKTIVLKNSSPKAPEDKRTILLVRQRNKIRDKFTKRQYEIFPWKQNEQRGTTEVVTSTATKSTVWEVKGIDESKLNQKTFHLFFEKRSTLKGKHLLPLRDLLWKEII